MKFYAYPKIPTAYKRDMSGSKMLTDEVADNTLDELRNIQWSATEKIDGMNCGGVWDGHSISFQGRTEKTFFTPAQLEYLNNCFNNEETCQIFEQSFAERPVVLYGELIGGGIQGNIYGDALRFVPFDLLLARFMSFPDTWANQSYLHDICFGLKLYPAEGLLDGTLEEVTNLVKEIDSSCLDERVAMEGVVIRPTPVELRNNVGERIFYKMKTRDFHTKEEIQAYNESRKHIYDVLKEEDNNENKNR